jgi:tetratricopeptide (TPR) repeat protein
MKMAESINYPPSEILQPSYGKPDYELIILWLLNNNEICTWTDLIKIIKKSTLSNYLTKLKTKNFIVKSQFNQYCITPTGKEKFYELSEEKSYKKKLNFPPKVILNRRIYEDLVLWMVYNNNSCKWANFIDRPLSINQSSLSKAIRRLIDNQYISKSDKEYQITYLGKEEYANILSNYNLDKQSILEEESRRIAKLTKKALTFFEEYQITDNDIRFRFLHNVIKLPYERVKQNLEDEEDFWKILLFLALNHPTFHSDLISTENFAIKYNIEKVFLDFHILQIVEKNIYPTKFFKLQVDDEKSAYFQENEKLEKILHAMVEEYITKFTYLNKLHDDLNKDTSSLTMEDTVNIILEDICDSIFHPSFKKPLKFFLPDYITYLAYKIERGDKMGGSFDKLESLIWQNIQKYTLISSQTGSEIKYYIDLETLRILNPLLINQLEKISPEVAQLFDIQDYSLSLRKITSFIKKNPNQPILHIMKAYTQCFLNEFGIAIDYLEKHIDPSLVMDTESLFLPYSFILGFSHFLIGEITKATNLAKLTLEKFPDHPLSNALTGLILGYNIVYRCDPKISDESYQLAHIDKSIENEQTSLNKSRLYLLKCQIFSDLKRNSEALEAIDQSIGLQPTLFPLYSSKIKVLLELNQYKESLLVLDQLIREFPNRRKNILLKKASIFKKMRKGNEGFRIIEELIEEYPNDNDLLLHQAYWQQYFNQKTESLETMKILTDRDPNNGIYFDTYGEILMSFEDYSQAIVQFNKSLKCELNSWNEFQTHIKLGICYKELEQKEPAIEHLKKGKELSEVDFCPIIVKQKWNAIADLFLAQIYELE